MISQGLVETEHEDPGFVITHLSFRKRESSHLYGGPVDYYIGNIVFRLTNEDAKGRMEYIMKKNETIRVATSEELLEKYYDGLHFKFDREREETNEDGEKFYPLDIINKHGIKDEDVFIYGYRPNIDPLHDFVEYIDKFNC